mgnify:FL=1
MTNETFTFKDSSEDSSEKKEAKPMTRLQALVYIASITDYGYPATKFRTKDPDEVTVSDVANMSDDELRDYTKARQIVSIFEATVPSSNRKR